MLRSGQRVRRLREQRGWSQLQLAEMVGLNNSVLSRIESGKRLIDEDLLCKFADVFDTTVDRLLGRHERISEASKIYESEQARRESEFLEQLREVAFFDGEQELSAEAKQIMMEALLDAAATTKKIISRTAKG